MKFYLAVDPETGRKMLRPNQEEARSINKVFQVFEVPTDKAGLMDFAQEALDRIHTLEGEINSLKHDAQIAPVTIPTSNEESHSSGEAVALDSRPEASPSLSNVQSIMEFLLDKATQAQVESIFSAIGARWGEARSKD